MKSGLFLAALHSGNQRTCFKKTLSYILRHRQLTQSRWHTIHLCACYKCAHFTQHTLVIKWARYWQKNKFANFVYSAIKNIKISSTFQQHLLLEEAKKLKWNLPFITHGEINAFSDFLVCKFGKQLRSAWIAFSPVILYTTNACNNGNLGCLCQNNSKVTQPSWWTIRMTVVAIVLQSDQKETWFPF